MKYNFKACFFAYLFSLVLINISRSLAASTSSTGVNEIHWQEMEIEVDTLAFKKTFIDSLKNLYSIIPHNNSLRSITRLVPSVAETLVYDINWGLVKAGYVILTVSPDPGGKTIRLGGKALSNNFISAFYRMRDYVISTIDANGLYPLFFEQHIREGKKYKADRWVIYDQIAGKAHIQEKSFKTVETPPFTHDYLSVIYQIRTMILAPGDTFSFHTYLNKGVHPLFFRCKERKKIKVNAGIFNCTLIEPRFSGDRRAFNKNDKLEVWLSEDEYRIPVLIKSKIKFGSITAQLIYQNHFNTNNKKVFDNG